MRRRRYGCARSRKLAIEHTDVGGIDVHVDHEVYVVAIFLPRHMIRHAADRGEIIRLEHGEAVGGRDALAGAHALPDGNEARIREVMP
jgi:hypothetical protein